MNKIELLAPAKDLFKAKIAVDYGADAVYIGGKNFSLRSRASNFSIDDIKEICEYAHQKNVKVYVTVNIIFHDDDFNGVKEYLVLLESLGVDAIIVSSFFVMSLAKLAAPSLEVHASTQLSTLNEEAIATLQSYGVNRVVLGRECSMNEIEELAKSNMPLEVFIHGGMCSNYSGRCVLSNRMTNRDANRGGCAHSCRWKYQVYDRDKLVSDVSRPLSFSSKDLKAVDYIERMINCKVASLKIEGRMKSEYYIAQVVKTYRHMIDEIYEKGHLEEERLVYYERELLKAENRPSGSGFLSGECDDSKHLYGIEGDLVTHDYVGIVKAFDSNRMLALVEVKNAFNQGDKLEAFGPNVDNLNFENQLMFNSEWKMIIEAHNPAECVMIRTPFVLHTNDMIRISRNVD